jgi:cation-transporting ATPase 13A1
MNGFNRVNVLFSGCTFVTIDSTIASTSSLSPSPIPSSSSSSSSQGIDSIPIPPDHGAIAFALRTGFGSSQGTLLQMIEFSQQTVSGDNDDDYYYYVVDDDDDDELITSSLSISQVIRKKQA